MAKRVNVRVIDIPREVRRIELCLKRDEAPCKVCQRGLLWSLCTGSLQRYYKLLDEQDAESREIAFLEALYQLEDPRL